MTSRRDAVGNGQGSHGLHLQSWISLGFKRRRRCCRDAADVSDDWSPSADGFREIPTEKSFPREISVSYVGEIGFLDSHRPKMAGKILPRQIRTAIFTTAKDVVNVVRTRPDRAARVTRYAVWARVMGGHAALRALSRGY